jgi:hypothetical protein
MSDVYSLNDSNTPARRVKGVFDQFATRAAPVTASDDPASWGAIPVARSGLKRVTDPAVLAQLNAPASTKVLSDNDPASGVRVLFRRENLLPIQRFLRS